jgi:hypothetical protein
MSATRSPRIARAAVTLVASWALPLRADTLVVDAVAEAGASATERPSRGMTMGTVERRWGAPANRAAAVGQPPITRWEYPGFTVFFEYQHVVHAVRRRAD